jgi:hypothetical protein
MVGERAHHSRDVVLRVRDAARAVELGSAKGVSYPGLVVNLLKPPGPTTGPDPYRAPEVRGGGALDAAAHVYSLGSSLYALLVSREPDPHSPQPPFQFDSSVPDDLEKLIRAAMHVDPTRRPSAAALAAELSDWLDSRGAPGVPRPTPETSALKDALVNAGLLALLLAGLAWPVPRGNAIAWEPLSRLMPILAPVATAEGRPGRQPLERPKVAVCPPPEPSTPTPPAPQTPARVGTVKWVHREYGVIVALDAPATLKVGDALEAMREESVVAALTVRILSLPEAIYPHGAAVCDASEALVQQGRTRQGPVQPGAVVRRRP